MLSEGFRDLLYKITTFAKALVVLGIIFLIQNWAGGNWLITIGGLIIIFNFLHSLFFPVPKQFDWSIVYPELIGISEGDEEKSKPTSQIDELKTEVEKLKKEIETLKKQ